MGIEQTVEFDAEPPSWPKVRALLADAGVAAAMRMIDGQLAFPDETPPDAWTELRVAAPGGMATIRRRGRSLAVVVFGGADAAMLKGANAVAWGLAKVGNGRVVTAAGPRSADEFLADADFPAGMKA
jgi:hypothetical protein